MGEGGNIWNEAAPLPSPQVEVTGVGAARGRARSETCDPKEPSLQDRKAQGILKTGVSLSVAASPKALALCPALSSACRSHWPNTSSHILGTKC